MMRVVTMIAARVFALTAADVSLSAQGRGSGQAKKPAVGGSKAKPASKPARTAAKTETRAVKAETRAAKAAAKADARAARTAAKADRKSGAARTTSTNATSTTVVTSSTPTTRAVKNPKLEARLLSLLPAGTTVQDASAGFKNWGQFVAAVHVSNNLNIPFADLKMKMTGLAPGTTVPTTTPVSLGQAIQSLKGADATTESGTLTPTRIRGEVKKAEDAADMDLRLSRDSS
jgi:hypothetical protein